MSWHLKSILQKWHGSFFSEIRWRATQTLPPSAGGGSDIAQKGEPYVVTTGTGSGKSLTYLVPIYDHILRNQPEKPGVRAIIVYPMNALINSQWEALKAYAKGYPENQVRFERYTGQDKDEARQRILDNPPHILLTNYVMLEYMLLRPAERKFTDSATAHLEFLVLD